MAAVKEINQRGLWDWNKYRVINQTKSDTKTSSSIIPCPSSQLI